MSETKHSAAYRIFHYYYKCWMPQHHLYDRAFMDTFGIPTTGDREVDRELAGSETLCQLNIADMAEHLSNGANLTLETPKDSVAIYQTVREHLMDWKRIVEDPINTSEPPVDDLRKLDELAGEIYKVAKGYMEKDDGGSRLFRHLNAMESRRGISRHAPQSEEKKESRMPSEHKPVSDFIAKTAFTKTHRWRKED